MVDIFCENLYGKFDIYKVSWFIFNGFVGFIVEFCWVIEKVMYFYLVLKRYRILFDVFGWCIRWLVVFWIS